MKSVARNACLYSVRANMTIRQNQSQSSLYPMISDAARRTITNTAYGKDVRMKIYIQLYGGHIQCVRTNFIIAVTC